MIKGKDKMKCFAGHQLLLMICLVMFFFPRCAKVGSPTGGPKDEDPPVVIESDPENYSTNFDQERIEITFDEYVQVKDARGNLIISPPLEEKPLIKIKGKGIFFDLEEELAPNTTYTFNFGDAIVDNNEGNPLHNFEFVFSTGNTIDSLSVTGKLVHAFDLQPPEEPFFVMLYDSLVDSVPYVKIPFYLGKTDKKGNFAINNVKSDTFRVFALKDMNNNLLYDLATEPIAFLDSLLYMTPDNYLLTDTLITDTALINKALVDSISPDSLLQLTDPKFGVNINLFFFKEDLEKQYMKDYTREDKRNLTIIFNRPVDSIIFDPLGFNDSTDWGIKEPGFYKDTIQYWLTDTSMIKSDTLMFSLHYKRTDSLNNLTWFNDTLNFRLVNKEEDKKRRGKRDEDTTVREVTLDLTLNYKSQSTIELNKNIHIKSHYPVKNIDTSNFYFALLEDTLEYEQSFSVVEDSVHPRQYVMKHEWKEDSRYKLILYPGAFKDIYGHTNDTLQAEYKTRGMDYYGKILLNMTGVDSYMIIQLLDNNEKVLQEKMTDTSGPLEFDYLKPKEYRLKVIYDRNKNNKWDTGDYLNNIQPEEVKYYKGEINIRSNWDLEVSWDIQ